ncbi:armadillo-type protein [Absidia repens]|uniref:Importin subunit alpha n=1 Tax=Absidia repens TaxID=90262 RepID=A0A1X2IU92_9FUNG|nr:armadillo-type protein [Absidia repens]
MDNKTSANQRKSNFKNKDTFQSDQVRNRRQQHTVDLRKQKREQNLSKRRNLTFDQDMPESDDELADQSQTENELHQQLLTLVEAINSDDVERQYDATIKLRKLLSKAQNPPIQQVVNAGLVPKFVEFLTSRHGLLQFEAAWALTNVASGTTDQTMVVIQAGALPVLVKLLSNDVTDVKEQAVWALGNIAGDGSECRDYVLAQGALKPLLTILGEHHKITMTRNATWALSNLCRGKISQIQWEAMTPALAVLAKLIYSSDEEVLTDSCWALSYLTNSNSEYLQAVVESGVCRRLVELLMHPSSLVQAPALRSVGNIVTGDDMQTQVIINCGVLPALLSLLSGSKETLRKEACWTVSNITAGNNAQIQAVIETNIIPLLIHILATGESKTRKEACWAIVNATSGGLNKPEQIQYMVSQGCIKPLCDILAAMDNRITLVALDGLENILKVGDMERRHEGTGLNRYALFIEECGGLDIIHQLQSTDNELIYKKAYSIIDVFFSDADDDNTDQMAENAPALTEGFQFQSNVDLPQGGFQFGQP